MSQQIVNIYLALYHVLWTLWGNSCQLLSTKWEKTYTAGCWRERHPATLNISGILTQSWEKEFTHCLLSNLLSPPFSRGQDRYRLSEPQSCTGRWGFHSCFSVTQQSEQQALYLSAIDQRAVWQSVIRQLESKLGFSSIWFLICYTMNFPISYFFSYVI